MIRATVVPQLLAVAFLTQVERKVMGAMQRRVGPSVWGFYGVLQALLDGAKLFLKEPILPSAADQLLFLWAPVLTFLTSQILWRRLPTSRAGAVSDLSLGTMYVLAVGSLGVYGIQQAGWSANSKYAFLGCCRSVAQMISYEQPMGIIVLTACLYANSLNWSALVHSQENRLFQFHLWPMAILWFVCSQAELNRAPMDLPEAEREQVAGYNVEYASMGFALFFIREYSNMQGIRALTTLLFFGGGSRPLPFLSFLPYSFWFRTKLSAVVFGYIWVRATLPRYKYNQQMSLGWKRLQPLSLAGFTANAAFVFVCQSILFYMLFYFFFNNKPFFLLYIKIYKNIYIYIYKRLEVSIIIIGKILLIFSSFVSSNLTRDILINNKKEKVILLLYLKNMTKRTKNNLQQLFKAPELPMQNCYLHTSCCMHRDFTGSKVGKGRKGK